MLCDIVDFLAKFQILSVHQILVCFTYDFKFAIFNLISEVFYFGIPKLPVTLAESGTHLQKK